MKYPLLFKLLVGFCLVSIWASDVQAQDQNEVTPSKTFQFGLRAGALLSNATLEQSSWGQEPESKIGADLAAIGKLPLGQGAFSLQPELHWMMKGYQIGHATTDSLDYGQVVSTFYFLELPVLLRYDFGGSLKLFVVAGPSLGYFIGGTQDSDAYGLQYFDQSTFNRIEFGTHFGVGVGIGPIELDVRYLIGWSDIAEGEPVVKNKALGVGVSYMF